MIKRLMSTNPDPASRTTNQSETTALDAYLSTLRQRIKLAHDNNDPDSARVLGKINTDLEKWLSAYEEKRVTFEEANREITALQNFSEIYVGLEDMGQDNL